MIILLRFTMRQINPERGRERPNLKKFRYFLFCYFKIKISSHLKEIDGKLSKAEDVSTKVDPGDEVTEQVVGGQRVAEQDLGQVVVQVSASRCLDGQVMSQVISTGKKIYWNIAMGTNNILCILGECKQGALACNTEICFFGRCTCFCNRPTIDISK